MGNFYWDRKVDVIFGPVFNPSLIYDNVVGGLNILPNLDISRLNFGNEPIWSERKYYHYTAKTPKDNVHVYDLRVKFRIKKTTEGTATNKGTIEIYNLSEEKWKVLEDDSHVCQVKLFAGYGGLDYTGKELIHYADVTNSYRKFADGNWICTLETGDGDFASQAATISKSYNKDMNAKTMIKDVVETLKNLGIDTVDAMSKIKSLDDLKQKVGSVLSGKSAKAMDTLVSKFGLRWNINNNKLVLEELHKALDDTILFLSPYTGLIGSPKREIDGIAFKCLLTSELDLDKVVYIESGSVNGYFLIDEIMYSGDTHGNSWECHCKGKPYKKPNEISEWQIPKVPTLDAVEWINRQVPLTIEDSIKNYQPENG